MFYAKTVCTLLIGCHGVHIIRETSKLSDLKTGVRRTEDLTHGLIFKPLSVLGLGLKPTDDQFQGLDLLPDLGSKLLVQVGVVLAHPGNRQAREH